MPAPGDIATPARTASADSPARSPAKPVSAAELRRSDLIGTIDLRVVGDSPMKLM